MSIPLSDEQKNQLVNDLIRENTELKRLSNVFQNAEDLLAAKKELDELNKKININEPTIKLEDDYKIHKNEILKELLKNWKSLFEESYNKTKFINLELTREQYKKLTNIIKRLIKNYYFLIILNKHSQKQSLQKIYKNARVYSEKVKLNMIMH